ncbi:MAG: dihydroorotase [Bacteroidota bacterium]
MPTSLLKHAQIVNEGQISRKDLYIKDGIIEQIGEDISLPADEIIDLSEEGTYLLPGAIDDQVHFREPGLIHKGEILTESRAAVAGGITSYMEMPNTKPQSLTQELLEQKYQRAAEASMANYSFFMGASNDNLEEVLKTDPKSVCGVKIFMGSSTGNMLVDNYNTLEGLFSQVPMLIATHCEKEGIIRENLAKHIKQYGDEIPIELHPVIRSEEACYASSSEAVALAKKHNTRLHILHISTAKELSLFDSPLPLGEKKITSEACIHHLWFKQEDYREKQTFIKWNPAVKRVEDRDAIRRAVISGVIDVVATDHAPHTISEKSNVYTKAPSGGPLVQHALVAMLEMVHQGVFTLEKVVEKMAHAPAVCFQLANRGYIREGYAADLVHVHVNKSWEVEKSNVLYKCGWSPFEGQTFQSQVLRTWINGHLSYDQGSFTTELAGQRLEFERA